MVHRLLALSLPFHFSAVPSRRDQLIFVALQAVYDIIASSSRFCHPAELSAHAPSGIRGGWSTDRYGDVASAWTGSGGWSR